MSMASNRRAAAAVVCLCCAPAVLAVDSIGVSNVAAAVYRGGLIQVDPDFEVVQSLGEPFSLQTGLASIGANWTFTHEITEIGPSWGLTMTVPMMVSASVAPEATSGTAEAFAGVAQFAFDVTFTGLPRTYSGAADLLDLNTEEFVRDGDTIAAGEYRFRIGFLSSMPTEVFVSAGPGQSNSNMFTRVAEVNLTAVPGPASMLGLGVGLVMGNRRRR